MTQTHVNNLIAIIGHIFQTGPLNILFHAYLMQMLDHNCYRERRLPSSPPDPPFQMTPCIKKFQLTQKESDYWDLLSGSCLD